MNRATIVITHRASTAHAADRVVVLDRGEVVEEGSPAELLRRGGLFARCSRACHSLRLRFALKR